MQQTAAALLVGLSTIVGIGTSAGLGNAQDSVTGVDALVLVTTYADGRAVHNVVTGTPRIACGTSNTVGPSGRGAEGGTERRESCSDETSTEIQFERLAIEPGEDVLAIVRNRLRDLQDVDEKQVVGALRTAMVSARNGILDDLRETPDDALEFQRWLRDIVRCTKSGRIRSLGDRAGGLLMGELKNYCAVI